MKIPSEILKIFEHELDAVQFGEVQLTIKFHDGQARNFDITKRRSIIPGCQTSGELREAQR